MTPGSIKRFILTLVLALSAIGLAAPVPVVGGELSGSALLGESVTLTATFENTGDTGYGPYIDFVLPANYGGVEDGITFTSGSYEGIADLQVVGPFENNTNAQIQVDHPYKRDSAGQLEKINLEPGEALYVLPLPFGSYTSQQPVADIELTFEIDEHAIPKAHEELSIGGGFRFGNTPTGVNGFVSASAVDTSIEPLVLRGDKAFSYRDWDHYETTIGPGFVREFTLSATIAEDQDVTGLTLTDYLPNDVVVLGNFVAVGSTIESVTLLDEDIKDRNWSPESNNADKTVPAETPMVIVFSDPLEDDVVSVTFSVYYPFLDNSGQAVAGHSTNRLEVAGTWSHATDQSWQNINVQDGHRNDNRISATVRLNNNTATAADKSASLKIQKDHRLATSGPSGAWLLNESTVVPGEVYEFRLRLQISDTSAYQNIRIRDILHDGFAFENDDVAVTVSGPHLSGTFNVAMPGIEETDSAAATQTVIFPLSEWLIDKTASTDGRLIGALINPATAEKEPYTGSITGTEVEIVYRAKVLESYRSTLPVSDATKRLLQGDVLQNDVAVDAVALERQPGAQEPFDSNGPQAHEWEDDTSTNIFSLRNSTPTKAVAFVDGVAASPGQVISAGDNVTFRLTVDMPTGNVGKFVVTDYLPLPIFDAEAGTWSSNGSSTTSTAPSDYQVSYSVEDTFGAHYNKPLPVPVADGNKLTFDFGTMQTPQGDADPYEPLKLDILITVPVVDAIMDDELLLTNQLEISETDNSDEANPTTSLALVQIMYGRPVLNITNTVVADHASTSSVDPFEIASDTNRQDYENDVTWGNDLDAGDVATVLAIVENTGTGPNGAYGLVVELEVPDHLTHVSDWEDKLQIWHGNEPSTLLSNYTATLNGKTLKIEFPDDVAILANGANNTSGSNILAIAYDVQLDSAANSATTGVGADSLYEIEARITKYHQLGQSSNNLAGGIHKADETGHTYIQTRPIVVTKTLSKTNDNAEATTDADVTIGEVATFEVTVSIPEGYVGQLTVFDELPTGLAYVANSFTATGEDVSFSSSPTVGSTSGTTCNTTAPPETNGENICFSFDEVLVEGNTNGVADGTITIEYDVLVLNRPTQGATDRVNERNDKLENSVNARYNSRDAHIGGTSSGEKISNTSTETLTIAEPDVNVTKTATPAGPFKADDVITYEITAKNNGTSPLFEFELTDVISEHFEVNDQSFGFGATTGLKATFDSTSNTITVTGDSDPFTLEPNEFVTFSFEVKVLVTALSGSNVNNRADVTGYSLPSGSNDDGWKDRRKYEPYGEYDVDIESIAALKTVVTTDQDWTTTNSDGEHEVAIGEVVTYRLASTIPPSTSHDVTITDEIPAGMRLVGTASNIRYYLQTDDSLVTVTPNTWQSDGTSPPDSGIKLTKPAPGASITTSGSVDTVEVTIDKIVNDDTTKASIIYIEYDVVVSDSTAGTKLTNDYTIVSKDDGGNPLDHTKSPPVTVHVIKPELTVTKSVTDTDRQAIIDNGDATNVDLGETLDFEVKITNNRTVNDGGTTAWGFSFTDTLPDELTPPDANAVTVLVGATDETSEFTINVTDQTITIVANDASENSGISLAPEETITVKFSSVVRDDVNGTPINARHEFTNTATAYSYTLPEAQPGINAPDLSVPTDDRAVSVTGTDDADITIAEPGIQVVKSYTEPTVGPGASPNETTYAFEIKLEVKNTGLIDVESVQLTEDLAAVYGPSPGTTINVGIITTNPSSPSLDINTNFNGVDHTGLLEATSKLGAGQSVTITIPVGVTFTTTDQVNKDYTNSVSITAKTKGGLEASDTANAVSHPTQGPELSITKSIIPDAKGDDVTVDPEGKYTITFALDVVNTGDVPVYNLQVTDNLRDALNNSGRVNPAGSVAIEDVVIGQASLGSITYTDSTLTLIASYDENAGVLLQGTDTLLPNNGSRITLTATFVPTDKDWLLTPEYENVAQVAGTQKLTEPNTNDPAPVSSTSDKVPFQFDEEALIGISTNLVGPPTQQADAPTGTYEFELDVTIQNYGKVNLTDVQAVLDFLAAQNPAAKLGDALAFTVESVTHESGEALNVNGDFDGEQDKELLAAGGSLAPGENTVIRIKIKNFVPAPGVLAYQVTAEATGESPLDSVTDESNDGGDPDVGGGTDNDGDPTNNTAPTPITFTVNSELGLAKELTRGPIAITDSVTGLSTGEFELDYTFIAQNFGDDRVNTVQIADDFAATFPGATSFSIQAITAPAPLTATATTLPINALGTVNLLDEGNSYLLSAAQAAADVSTSEHDTGTVVVTIRVMPGNPAALIVHNNSAVLSGNDASGATITPDKSNDSDTPNPGKDEPTPVQFEAPGISVEKTLTSQTYSNSGGSNNLSDHRVTAVYTITVENTGDVPLHNVQVVDDLGAVFGSANIDSVAVSAASGLTAVGSYDISNGNLLAGTDTLPVGTDTYDVTLTVVLKNLGTIGNSTKTNTVTATGETDLGGKVQSADDAELTIDDKGEIALGKTAEITYNETTDTYTVDFTFTIKNTGETALENVTLTDSLEGQDQLLDVANQSGAITAIGGSLQTQFDPAYTGRQNADNLLLTGVTIGIGETKTLTIRVPGVTLKDDSVTSAENTATVEATTLLGNDVTDDSNDGVPTSGDNTPTPLNFTKIDLKKSVSASTANIGEVFTYTITATFPKDQVYNDITIEDVLPAGLAFTNDQYSRSFDNGTVVPSIPATPETVTHTGTDRLTVSLDSVTTGTDDAVLTLSFDVIVLNEQNNTAGTVITNRATVEYGSGGTPGKITSNEVETTLTEPKLEVTKVVSDIISGNQGAIDADGNATNIDRGDVLEFTISIENVGDGPAYGLAMVDAIPDGMEISNFNQIAYELDGNSQTPSVINLTWVDPGRVNEKLTVEYHLNVLTIPAGSTLTIVYEATVNDHAGNTSGADLVNEVEATSTSTNDPNNPQNRNTSDGDTATVTLAEPTLEITKSLESMTYNGGQEFTFVFGFEIENTGLINLNRVNITDALPFTQTQVDSVTVAVPDTTTWTGDTTSYNGYANTTVYNGEMPTLAPNATSDKVTVTVVATLEHIDDLNADTNTAKAVGRTPGGDGIKTPEHSNDVPFTPSDIYQPSVGITKSATTPVNNGDGSYTTTYTIVVENDSSAVTGVDLVNPQVIDNLATTFADAASFTVDSASATHSDTTDHFGLLVDLTNFGQTIDAELIDYTNGSITLKRPTATDPGETLTIEFAVTFWPEPSSTNDTYNNVASTTTESPFEDGPPIENDTPPVAVTYDEAGLLGVSTSYDETATVDHGDGSYTITLEIDLKNYGITTNDGVQLDNISVPFDLADYFSDAAHFEYVGGTLSATNGFTVNPNYDGDTDTELLVPSDTDVLYAQDQDAALGPKDTKITLEVLVVPGNELYYEVETTATAKTPLGRTATDDSNDGGDPDVGGGPTDDDPTNNTAPTPILFPDEPLIGAAKAFEQTSLGVTGTPGEFTLTFTFVVQNYGNAQLNDVSLTDDFDDVFDDGSNWAVTDIRVINGSVAPASTFPDKGTPNGYELLDKANSKLASEAQAALPNATLTQQATVEVDLVVTPNTPGREYENTAVAAGTSPSTPTNPTGTTTDDESQDGLDPDPDGDGDPTNNNDPTPFRFERPDIGVTKSATTDIRPDGQMDVYYTFTITNEGDVDLSNVQLTDNLDNALGAGNYRVMSLYSSTLTVNAIAPTAGGFNGSSVTELLTGTDTIPTGKPYADPIEPGAPHEVHLHVVVKDPDANGATNTAYVQGTSPAQNVVDDSATHTVVPNEDPHIALAKSATVNLLADGTFNVDYRFTVANVGNVELHNVQITDDLADLYASTDVTAADISRVYSELTYNPSFDGQTDPNVLTGTDTLKVGQEKTVIIRLRGITANHANAIVNSATATGTGPYGGTTTDKSNDGLTPEPGTDVPTEIILVPTTQIAIAKQSVAQQRADGGYDVTFTLRVANVGNSQLLGVQVRDTLEDFYAKTNLTASKISVSSSDFAVNPSFDGQNDSDLLTGTDVLAVGGAGTITIDITNLQPNSGVSEVENTAIATGRDSTGKRTTDTSNDGVTPDPNDDTPTITPLSPQPQIGIAKRAAVTLVSGNTYTAVFDFVLKNYGNTDIHNVQVTDDLSEFYTEVGLSAANISVSAAGLTPNPSYDGQTDTNVLSGSDTLQLGETKTITITLTGLVVANPPKTLLNTAVATGTDPSGNVPTEDTSTDGDDPDPDGNNDPTDNDDPTPVAFDAEPLLGLAKDVTVEPGSTEGLKITFDILVRNYGNTDIVNLQVIDNLYTDLLSRATSHDAPQTVSADFAVDPAYTGNTTVNLLLGTDTLVVGGEGMITITIDNFVPDPRYREGENLAVGEGETPGGNPVTDGSYPGTDPDPDGDGDPTNNDAPTIVPFTVQPPVVGIAKKATVTDQGDGKFDVELLFTVKNYSNTDASDIQIRDDLTDLYAQTTLAPANITLTSSDFATSSTYDGQTNVNLLQGSGTLAAGATGTVTMHITGISALGSEVEVYNTAIVSGNDPRTGDPIVPDESTDGEDPDPDGDGDPHNNKTPTPITFHVEPKVGLAKAATVNATGDGKHDITFTIRAVNYGDTELTNVSITDSLDEFYRRTNLTVANVSVTSSDFTTNPLFDGQTDTELLGGGNSLQIGESGTVTITLSDVIPAADVTRLYNSAFITAGAPGGRTVDDTSHDGHDPDPTGGDNPGDYNDPTPVDFTPVGSVLLEKTAEKGEYEIGDAITYTVVVSNPHDVAITFTLEDHIPANTLYIDGSTTFSNDNYIPLDGSEPRQRDHTSLEWRSIVLPGGEQLTITYQLRILPGAEGTLTNVVTIDGEDANSKKFEDETTADVKVNQGIFDRNKSVLIGRVFVDVNNNSMYDEGIDIPVEHARVILSNGWQTTTDGEGNYAFRNIDSGTWSVQLDERTAPYAAQRHPEQLRDMYQHRVSVQGVTVSDFPLVGVIGEIETERETFVTYGPVTLHKYVVESEPGTDTVVITISSTEELPAEILVTDPQPTGEAATYVVQPTPGAETTITYELPAGSAFTDPILEWSNQ